MKVPIGKLEGTFLAAVVLYLTAIAALGRNTFSTLVGYTAVAIGVWLSFRLSRRIVRELLWRLRNRLIIAYFFIAVVPLVLTGVLVGLSTAILSGQISIYLLTQELDRRTEGLRAAAEFLVHGGMNRQEWSRSVAPSLRLRYPGLEIYVADGQDWVYPPQAELTPPSSGPENVSGLIIKEGLLHGWTYVRQDGRRVLAMFPITREYLGSLVPDIGESSILDVSSKQGLIHEDAPDSVAPTQNRLPPAANGLDFEVRWISPVTVYRWNEPAGGLEWLTIRTRPSAVLRAVFQQKVDLANDLVYFSFVSVCILFLVAEMIALILGISLTKTITGAVHEMYEGTLRVTKGDFAHRIPLHGEDQLGELAISFNQMTENVQRLLSVEKERERLQTELEIAREVQNQLYPKAVPAMECLRLTASCQPARMVSGDYYDYQQIDNRHVAIAIGDVAGKGISAALLMATIQACFRAQLRGSLQMAAAAGQQAIDGKVSTSTIVSRLNEQLYSDTAPEKYATFFLSVFDEQNSTLTYTNAGHLPPILVRGSEITRLDVNGMVVGAFPFAKYDESRLRLEAHDLLVFFTDGISEPENEYGEMFGEERLEQLAVQNAHLDDAAIVDAIKEAVRQWTGAGELQDDMTLMLVRRC